MRCNKYSLFDSIASGKCINNKIALIFVSFLQQSHILTLLQNRVHKFPSGHNDLGIDLYWKYLCYEMLFLWSVLSNVQPDKLTIIVKGKQQFYSDCA